MSIISFTQKNILIVSIIIMGIVVSLSYPLLSILAVIFFIAFQKYKEALLINCAILLSITYTGEDVIIARDYVTFLVFITLFVIFIKKYGLNFEFYPKIPDSLLYFFILLFVTLILSTTVSGLNTVSIQAIIRFIVFILLFYFVYGMISSFDTIINYFYVLIIANLIISFSIYEQIIYRDLLSFFTTGYLIRYYGIYAGPNIVALLTMITSLICISFLFMTDIKLSNKKWLIYMVLVNNFLILLATNSRFAIAGTVLGSITLLSVLNRNILLKFIFGLTIIFVVLLLLPQTNELVNIYMRIETVNARDNIWHYAWEIASENPLFGSGVDKYSSRISNYVASNDYRIQEGIRVSKPNPHNILLLYLSENGILGVVTVLFFYFVFFRISANALRINKELNRDYYIVSLTITTIGILIFIRSMFEIDGFLNYGFLTQDFPFWILLASLIYLNKKFTN